MGKWPRLEGSVSEFLLRGFFNAVHTHTLHVSSPNPLRVEGLEWTKQPPGHWLSGTSGRSLPLCAQNAAYLSVDNWGSPCVPGSPECSLSLSTPKSSVCHHLTVTQTHLYLFFPDLVFHIRNWQLRPPRPWAKILGGGVPDSAISSTLPMPCARQSC